MKQFATLALAVIALTGSASTLAAGHANPWTDDLSEVREKNHDSNQAKSTDTPGEDEMRGVMSRNAHGKTSGTAAGAGSGSDGSGSREASGGRGAGKR
ncbi:hypothetical protein [Salipiger bermudensis]|uniref:Uncharacterized protein n=1 Tax=Salipiger bermudensis (strain DSM 26914 / JCM 13377 / KCTC 12554 / HTCC2601) TaxID=314265 RepID=Q0FN23_SALBH|nr:hypothetical protein [Salipiger bermudensis]EAU45619.1 hypothetical protein R2601_22037 [Salipiger bermudensis HTCC2601]